ncbi:GNAT family N-acetyltransferase [Massilia terrae]|uniref:GNAT family N-acetyltransferase n=1 Tax=Massilia terrae TaxID=1811224 RepID=A0ABT2D0H1_9BURK|nr:GNAT family N-acetyltransferase [Massilia terrae]MCS0659716.1 GNAT family N-acetyltransferase [Massilia terrae]
MITVRRAQLADVAVVAPLFDAYRQFYGRSPDPELAARFLTERIANGESIVYLAETREGEAVGFTQLYPSFSSVSARRIYILNDLFVVPTARRANVGRGLLHAAGEFARGKGALRLALSTAKSNEKAQALYESEGWVRDQQYYHYSLEL